MNPREYRPPSRVPRSALTGTPSSSSAVNRNLRTLVKTMRAPEFFGTKPIRFGDLQYQLMITNAGSASAFARDQILAFETEVMPDSSARVHREVLRAPSFVSNWDRLAWRASGAPNVTSPTDHAGASIEWKLPAGDFSFTPHGRIVTSKQVRTLPSGTRSMVRILRQWLDPSAGLAPPASLSLRQYGFLLATAPITRTVREAVLRAIGMLPGVYMCGSLFATHPLHHDAFCVNGDPTDTEVLLDPRTGAAVVVCERLDGPTPLYPHLSVGALVSSDTFSLQATSTH
jgi:hypothetical protein